MTEPRWQIFPDGETLAAALSAIVAGELAAAIAERGQALLAVSGGTTPGKLFNALSNAAIDWSKVTVTLVDERFVERSSPRANATLVRERLLAGGAAAACFVDLYAEAASAAEAARMLDGRLAALPWPLDVALLGMGLDGHTASFFPDAPNLAALLDPAGGATVLAVQAPSAPEPRLTLTLSRLKTARSPILHIEGQAKRDFLEGALARRDPLPIVTALERADNPARIFWAP